MRELREERVQWRHAKWDEAATNWKSYRWAKRARTFSWQPGFEANPDGNPLEVITEHFERVFSKHAKGSIDVGFREIGQSIVGSSPQSAPYRTRSGRRCSRWSQWALCWG